MTCKQSLKSCQTSEGMSSGSYFRCDSAEIIICGSHKCKCTTQPLLSMHLIMSFILLFLSSSVYVSFMSFPLWSVFYPWIAYTFLLLSPSTCLLPCHLWRPMSLGYKQTLKVGVWDLWFHDNVLFHPATVYCIDIME